MKKLLFLKLFICIFAMNAQDNEGKLAIEKGTWNIGGRFAISSNNNTNTATPNAEANNFGFSITPSAAYFLHNNVSIGLALGYGYFESENISGTNESLNFRNQYSIAPTIKKLFPVSKNFAFSLQGELGYSYSESKASASSLKFKENSYSISIRPGIDFFVTKKLALQANIGALQYLNINRKAEDSSNVNLSEGNSQNFDFNLNSSTILFGLSYYL
ncbi:DUF6850 family outer membrane beta-barrel protein [Tenacibaculum jejuense]|uniref:Outer membrane protein beta-barrel domain-containing protein n=1 Tax=Tenacibaculum jejuense TaxID=584609 RepID=A0A238U7C4_9FLAO|nr:DUF6850 family outer membrane beta-barrel protein [Tenacibaculum jejuense]SNR15057.1 conserved exported protein of unknown function [Tenacibaculum jejuense]